jgi:hypothetical protein
VCMLCRKRTKPNDRVRPVRAVHYHWARLMELDSADGRGWLSGAAHGTGHALVGMWDTVCVYLCMCVYVYVCVPVCVCVCVGMWVTVRVCAGMWVCGCVAGRWPAQSLDGV